MIDPFISILLSSSLQISIYVFRASLTYLNLLSNLLKHLWNRTTTSGWIALITII